MLLNQFKTKGHNYIDMNPKLLIINKDFSIRMNDLCKI